MLSESIDDFTNVLRIDPNHFNAAYARGACENKRGNYLKAIEDYNLALEKDKRNNASPRRIPLASVNYILDSNAKETESVTNVSATKYPVEESKPMTANPSMSKLLPPNGIGKENPSSSSMFPSDASSIKDESSRWKINPNESQTIDDYSINNKAISLNESSSSAATNHKEIPPKQRSEAEKYHSLGYEARKKGDYNSAISYYSKAISLWDGFFKAYFNRGFAYDKLGDFEKAISDYSKALEIEPKNAFVYYNRGVSLDKLQRYDEAIYNFSMAITLDPTKADFYHNRGFAFRKKLDYEKAIQDYSKAISLNPSHFKVFLK